MKLVQVIASLLLVTTVRCQTAFGSWEKNQIIVTSKVLPKPTSLESSAPFLTDGCKNYKWLKDDLWRNAFSLTKAVTRGCNSVRATFGTWYRFGGLSGNDMLHMGSCTLYPTSPCAYIATFIPGWKLSENVSAHPVCQSDGTKCYCYDTNVLKRSCGSYNVYYMQEGYTGDCTHGRFCGNNAPYEEADMWSVYVPSTERNTTRWVDNVKRSLPLPTNLLKDDGCVKYRTLGDPNRSPFTRECPANDGMVGPGWYRFGGSTGLTILSTCPAGLDKAEYHCPWVMSEDKELVSLSGVRRLFMCAAYSSNCDCSLIHTTYARSCGSYEVYWLGKQEECSLFDKFRYCPEPDEKWGNKSFSYDLSCETSHMTLVLNTKYYVDDVQTLKILEGPCKYSWFDGKIALFRIYFNTSTCGTKVTVNDDSVIYENTIYMEGTTNFIDSSDVSLRMVCSYQRSIAVSSYSSYRVVPTFSGNIGDTGRFTVSINLGISASDVFFARRLQLRAAQRLFVQLKLSSNTQLFMNVRECFVAPSDSRVDDDKRMIVSQTGSCLRDPTYQNTTSSYSWPDLGFSFAVRNLTIGLSAFFIHCRLHVCSAGSSINECRPTCNINSNITEVVRKRRDLDPSTRSERDVYVGMGPVFLLDKEEDQVSKPLRRSGRGGGHSTTSLTSVLIGVVVGAVSVVLIVLGVVLAIRRRNSQSKLQSLKTGAQTSS